MSVGRARVLKLYKDLLREASKFSTYNFRMYALRRVRDSFHVNRGLVEPVKIERAYTEGIEQLDLIKRQVIISRLYKTDELVIEKSRQTSI